MTLNEALALVNETVRNSVSDAQKTMWLAELDGELLQSVFDTHEGMSADNGNLWVRHVLYLLGRGEEGAYTGAEELLVPFPFDGLYVYYLCFKLYLLLAENARAAAGEQRFKEKLTAYENFCNRTYLPNAGARLKAGG